MKLTIQSVHFDAKPALKDFATQKVGKLERFYDGIIAADVVLSLDKADDTENKVSRVALSVPNGNLVAEKQCKTFEEGIDLACEALKKQLLKHKEK